MSTCKDCDFYYYRPMLPSNPKAGQDWVTPAKEKCMVDPKPVTRYGDYPICERFKRAKGESK